MMNLFVFKTDKYGKANRAASSYIQYRGGGAKEQRRRATGRKYKTVPYQYAGLNPKRRTDDFSPPYQSGLA